MTGFVSYTIDAEGAIEDLRLAQRQVRLFAQKGLRKGVKDIAVPRARSIAPHKSGDLASSIRSSITGLTGYLESRDPKAGLIEFGGTRRDVINPKSKKAVTPAGGVAVRRVKSPRTYKGQHKMLRAAEQSADEIADVTERAILDAFAAYFEID